METLRHLDPLTDEQKEVFFDVTIEKLTNDEIIEKYGDMLTYKEKIALGISE